MIIKYTNLYEILLQVYTMFYDTEKQFSTSGLHWLEGTSWPYI